MFTFGAKPNPRIAIEKGKIREEKREPVQKPKPLVSKIASHLAQKSQDNVRPQKSKIKARSTPATPDRLDPSAPRKRKPQRQISPAQQLFSDESESDEEGESPSSDYIAEKKQKSEMLVDAERPYLPKRPFSEADNEVLIHAADVADKNELAISVELQYPASSHRERFRTFFEKNKDDVTVLRPVNDFIKISELVADIYVKDEQKVMFTAPEPNPGLLRKLEKAGNWLEKESESPERQQTFKDAVNAYSDALGSLMRDGRLNQNFDGVNQRKFVQMTGFILEQVYERAVSPQIKTLTKLKQKDSKDNTYGELLHPFLTQIFSETKLKSDQVFVDLGSGVGNVVLQAALEVGCESWGCEMMDPACKLADAQKKELAVRCRLWGIRPGRVHLERGDFRENRAIQKAMSQADVILVNNEVFGSDLNQDLINMFLDVKDGCKIVSLKSFVPHGHKMTERNANNPVNLLRNEPKRYYEDFVSWKHEGGSYFIATKISPQTFTKD